MKLRTYLRIINPIVAVLVLLICLWAGMVDEGDFKPSGVIQGSISTYFLAKGLFCSSALFVLGKILEMMLAKPDIHINESQVED
jgi:hypothetical protein